MCAGQDGVALYSMRDPLWKLGTHRVALTPNASVVGGLTERYAQRGEESEFLLWLEQRRLAVSRSYERWKELIEAHKRRYRAEAAVQARRVTAQTRKIWKARKKLRGHDNTTASQ